MRKRGRQLLAMFMAASLAVGSGSVTAYAEKTAKVKPKKETSAEQEQPAEVATEAPVIVPAETQAPTEAPTEAPAPVETQAPTEAPTEAPVPVETQAPTEAPTEAPAPVQTEAPTEAPAPVQTEAPTEATAPAPSQPASETQAEPVRDPQIADNEEDVTIDINDQDIDFSVDMLPETMTETDEELGGPSTMFMWQQPGTIVMVELDPDQALPAGTVFTVTELTKDSGDAWKNARSVLKRTTDVGHRELSGAHFYKMSFSKDGQKFKVSGNLRVTMVFDGGLSVKLDRYAQGEAAAYAIGDAAEKLEELALNEEQCIEAAEVTLNASSVLALAGVQNAVNDGKEITGKELLKNLDSVLDYSVLTVDYEGNAQNGVLAADVNGQPVKDPTEIRKVLKDLSGYSLILANGVSTEKIKVVNLYADEFGVIQEEPLRAVLNEKQEIDVTDHIIIVNVIAQNKDQKLTVPDFPVGYDMDEVMENGMALYDGAERVIYNFAAENGNELEAYTGEIILEEEGIGTYLVPEGSVKAERNILGAVYADKVKAAEVMGAVVGSDGFLDDEIFGETVKDGANAVFTEEMTESETELFTEAEIETESETESETVPEELTEAAMTEAASELETEVEEEAEDSTENGLEELGLIEETELAEDLEEVVFEEEETEAAQNLEAEGGKADALPVYKTTGKGKPVAGATLQLVAAQDIVPVATAKVKNAEDEEVTFEKGATAYTKGTVIREWVSSEKGFDISEFLILGGHYVLREIAVPEGHTMASDYYFSIVSSGTYMGAARNSNNKKITKITMIDEVITEQETSGTVILKVAAVEELENKTLSYLSEAEFAVRDEEGNIVKDRYGSPLTFASTDGVVNICLSTTRFPTLFENMKDGDTKELSIAELKTKEKYTFGNYSEMKVTLKMEGGAYTLTLPEDDEHVRDGVLLFVNIPDTEDYKGSITVTKRNYFGNSQIYASSGAEYYVALFADEDKTTRISEVKTIQIKKGYKAATVRFPKLANGTYYVGETNQYGAPVGDEMDKDLAADPFYAEYVLNGKATNKVVIKVKDDVTYSVEAEAVTLNNHYFELPEGFMYTATFTVEKQLVDNTGVGQKSTFYAGVYTRNASGEWNYAGKKAIRMNGSDTRSEVVELPMATSTKEVMIKEMNADNTVMADGSPYTITYTNQTFTLSTEQAAPKVVITNTRVSRETESESQSETLNPKPGQATLKMTKKVTYKNSPTRVNQTYYIGIYMDKSCDKKYLLKQKAISLADASEKTGELVVNLDKTAKGTITLYFQEVDANGNRLESGTKSGYDISYRTSDGSSVQSVTLDANHMVEEIVVTNNIIVGGSVENNLADPTSNFGGTGSGTNVGGGSSGGSSSDGSGSGSSSDATSLADAENLSSGQNASSNTKTGDETPLVPILIALGASALVIILLAVLLVVRKRKK